MQALIVDIVCDLMILCEDLNVKFDVAEVVADSIVLRTQGWTMHAKESFMYHLIDKSKVSLNVVTLYNENIMISLKKE